MKIKMKYEMKNFWKNRKAAAAVGIIIGIYLITMFIKKTDFIAMLVGLTQDTFVKTGVPAYTYMNNLESEQSKGVFGAIVNDIYPMNEYLMANDYYHEGPAGGEDVLYAASEGVIHIVASEENSEQETKEQDTEEVKETLSNADEEQSGSTAESSSAAVSVSAEVAAAIQRKEITGTVYSKAELSKYNFAKRFYTVTSVTALTQDIFRPAEFLNKDLRIGKDPTKPQILIFHTHSQEGFTDSKANDPATTIVGVGDYLAKILTEKYGYNVIHDTSVYDLINGKLDRSKAYTYAQEGIDKILKQYPSIEVVIDLHRDGVAENKRLITQIDGKQTAQIMFFNGLSYSNMNGNIEYLYNPFRDDNLAMSLQMHLLGEAYYPGFLRNIYINAYRYCLHKRGRSMLVEAGAQTNTQQEVKNAMEPLADLLDKLLRGEKAY